MKYKDEIFIITILLIMSVWLIFKYIEKGGIKMKYYHIQLFYTPKGDIQENLLFPCFFNRKRTLYFLKEYYRKCKPSVVEVKIKGLVFKPKKKIKGGNTMNKKIEELREKLLQEGEICISFFKKKYETFEGSAAVLLRASDNGSGEEFHWSVECVYYHPLTNQECDTPDQCFVGWSVEDANQLEKDIAKFKEDTEKWFRENNLDWYFNQGLTLDEILEDIILGQE